MKRWALVLGVLTGCLTVAQGRGQAPPQATASYSNDPALYNGLRPGFFLGPTYLPGYFSMPSFYLGTLTGPVQGFGSYYGPGSYLGNSYYNPGYLPGYNSRIPEANDSTNRLYTFRAGTDVLSQNGLGSSAPIFSGYSTQAGKMQILKLPRADEPAGSKSVSPSTETPPAEKARVFFNVKVPADAELWFEGFKTSQQGERRKFQTPPLEPGKTFTYEIRARWTEDNGAVNRLQKFKVKAGDVLNIDFTVPASEKAEPPPRTKSGNQNADKK